MNQYSFYLVCFYLTIYDHNCIHEVEKFFLKRLGSALRCVCAIVGLRVLVWELLKLESHVII